MIYSSCFLLLLLLMEHLVVFASASDYFDHIDNPVDEVPGSIPIYGQESLSSILIGSKSYNQRRFFQRTKPPRHRPRPTVHGRSHVPKYRHGAACVIEVYKVTTTITKKKFETNVTQEAFRIYNINRIPPKDPEHVLTLITSINKKYTIASLIKRPCIDPTDTDSCQLRHWTLSLTAADMYRNIIRHNLADPNLVLDTPEHENYTYAEKIDMYKHAEEEGAPASRRVFTNITYIRDPCRSLQENSKRQLFECYLNESDGKNHCQCQRDPRPSHLNQQWLIYDKARDICVAPVESICAIRDTGYYPIECVTNSKCDHTTGLDDSFIYCARLDPNPRKTADLFKPIGADTGTAQPLKPTFNQYLQFTGILFFFTFYW